LRLHLKLSGLLQTPLMEWDGPKAPTGIHSPSDLKYHPIEKATAISDSMGNQFTLRDLRDDNH